MSEITRLAASVLADRIRQGRLSAIEVVDAYLERMARIDPEVAAYVTILADRARSDARQRDAEARAGRWRGALHGVPVAIKDLVAIEGVPMTAGSSFLGSEPSRRSATVVRRLETAGAIVLGTTTLHEFALGMTSRNPHGRTPRNPWHLERITGGSSGGSAAAVAADLAPGAVGTDTGGSIRIPAALCGIVGLKPTFGRVSRAGVLPLSGSFDTVGPMTRTVEDVALFLQAMAGADPEDPQCSTKPLDDYAAMMRNGPPVLRLGRLSGRFFESDLDPAVHRALDSVTRAAEAEGFPVRSVRLSTVEEGQEAQVTILLAEAAAFHRDSYPGRRESYGHDVRTLLDRGASVTPVALEEARAVQQRVMTEMSDMLATVDLLFGPALPIGAPALADVDPEGVAWLEIRRQLGRFSRLYNLTGLPCIVLPVRVTGDGLPVAVQLASAPFTEGLLLATARRLESVIGWVPPELPRQARPRADAVSEAG